MESRVLDVAMAERFNSEYRVPRPTGDFKIGRKNLKL